MPLVASCSERRFLILQLVKTHGFSNICLIPPFKSPCFSSDNPFRPFLERVCVFDSRILLLKLYLSLQFVPLTTFGLIHHLRASPLSSVLSKIPKATHIPFHQSGLRRRLFKWSFTLQPLVISSVCHEYLRRVVSEAESRALAAVLRSNPKHPLHHMSC